MVVIDTSFCIKQAPGNAEICDLDAKTDGVIAGFSLSAKTLSSGKVAANGLLQLLNADKEPQACTLSVRGSIFFDTKLGALRYLVISIAMVAATLERAEDCTVAALRIAVGSCSAKAQRLRLLELMALHL